MTMSVYTVLKVLTAVNFGRPKVSAALNFVDEELRKECVVHEFRAKDIL